jgi:FkbM family methyltransferase
MKAVSLLRSRLKFGRKKSTPVSSDYYEQQPSCQISYLSSLFEIFLGRKDDGVFVEIGANDGVSCSNTWGLAVKGWRGFLVEAIPDFAAACARNHESHRSVSVHQVAIGEIDGELVTFNIGGQLTTANMDLKLEYQNTEWAKSIITSSQIQFRTMRLDTFLEEQHVEEDFDVLVVDVEGFEAQVFAGFSIAKWHPKMVIVELTDTHPHLRTNSKSDALLGRKIIKAGYEIVYKDCINTAFIRKDLWQKVLD